MNQATVVSEAPKNRSPQTFYQAALDFERSKNSELRSSRKLAWTIATIASVAAGVAIVTGMLAILFRAEPEPTIIKVTSTGEASVSRSIKDTKDKYDEVINRYWLALYVRAREGYDWYTISQQFEAVRLMSESDVASEYGKKVREPGAPLVVLKDKGRVDVKVGSVVFVGDVAQVRFTTEKVNTAGDNTDNSPTQRWIATIAFQFKSGLMTDQQRLINPLGFKVLSYRVDPEVTK